MQNIKEKMEHFDWFKKWSVYNPDKVAFKEYETGREYTFAQVNHLANLTAQYFINDLGASTGDRVAVLSENNLEYMVLFAVAQKTGLTLVPLNYRLTSRELDFMLADSDPDIVLWEKHFADKIQNAAAYKTISHKIPMEKLSEMHKKYLSIDAFSYEGVHEFDEDHPVFLIYTSGTTAFPKGAKYTHKMLLWNSLNTEIRLDITSSDRAINCAPPFHTGSWNVLLATFVLHGAYTLLMRNFDADAVLEQMDLDKHTIFWGVPTMLKLMVDSPKFESVDLSRIRYFVIGGEAMPIPLIKIWDRKGVPVRQGYGLTEVGPNVTSLDHSDAIRKQGSIGTPNFFYQTKLVNEQGKEVKNNEIGELIIKSATVTPGYWKNEEATRNTIVDGWFHTGDLMKKDDEGYLYVVDRIKNMYISGGENVYPAEVEHLIRQLDDVRDVAIIGVPHEKWGETGKAFIVKKSGSDLSEKQVIDYCRKNLAKYKTPAYIKFLEQLPVNNAGKIDRKTLRDQEKTEA